MGIQARNRLRALKYLFRTETHESTVASARDDYDTYWVYLTRNEQRAFVNEDDPLDPPTELVRMIVHPTEENRILVSRCKVSEEDKPPIQTLTERIAGEANFEVAHYFKDSKLTYSSPITAALFRRLGLTHVQYWIFNLTTQLLARRIRPVKSRADVLEAILDLHEERYRDIKFYTVSHRLLGPKKSNVRHRRKLDHWRQVKNIIDSLLYTGELKTKGNHGSVVPTGKAYASLMDWQREIAREKGQLKRELFVIILTALIAFGTVKQAITDEAPAHGGQDAKNGVLRAGGLADSE